MHVSTAGAWAQRVQRGRPRRGCGDTAVTREHTVRTANVRKGVLTVLAVCMSAWLTRQRAPEDDEDDRGEVGRGGPARHEHVHVGPAVLEGLVPVASRLISPPWRVNSISSGSPHVRPMGRTCGEPDEIKKNTHPKNITALFRGRVPAHVEPPAQPELDGRGQDERDKVLDRQPVHQPGKGGGKR